MIMIYGRCRSTTGLEGRNVKRSERVRREKKNKKQNENKNERGEGGRRRRKTGSRGSKTNYQRIKYNLSLVRAGPGYRSPASSH